MMQMPTIGLEIDGMGISPDDVQDIMIISKIDNYLPEMSFKIKDNNATIFPTLKIYIGARVKAYLIDKKYTKNMSDTDPKGNIIKERLEFCDFVVSRLYNGFEFGTEDGAGYIQVWCTHAWNLYGDYTGHAYAPQKISELIKSICKSTNNLITLNVKDENIFPTSDKGAIPRYKSCESDLDFIKNKLLPYTNVDDSNAFFYVDYMNDVHLTSFSKMVNSKEKVLIVPQAELTGSLKTKIEELAKQKNLNGYYPWNDIQSYVGSEETQKQLAQLREKVFLENNSTGKVYIGYQEPSSTMGKNSGKTYQTKVPINGLRLRLLDATSCNAYPNRVFGDALALARSNDVYLEDILSIELTVGDAIPEIIPGDTAYLLMPLKENKDETATKEEKKKVVNWMNGKWVIYSVGYAMASTEDVATQIRLIRSSLVFNTETSTIDKPQVFYTIGGE